MVFSWCYESRIEYEPEVYTELDKGANAIVQLDFYNLISFSFIQFNQDEMLHKIVKNVRLGELIRYIE